MQVAKGRKQSTVYVDKQKVASIYLTKSNTLLKQEKEVQYDVESSSTREKTCKKMLSAEMRGKLADKLNKIIDIPFLNEDHEEAAIERFLNGVLGPLESNMDEIIPESDMEEMRADPENSEKRSGIQNKIVGVLNKFIDIPFVNEKQEAAALNMIVDFVIKDKLGQKQDE